MSFEIIIKETKTFEKVKNPEWEKIDSEEVERDSTFYHSEDEPKTRIKDIMGYTPEIKTTVTETNEIYRQSVDSLDLPVVILAVNKIMKHVGE
jgi:hypothetical protein